MSPSSLLGQPFEWGKTDCVCVTFSWLDAALGSHLSRLVLGKYDNEDTAYLKQLEIRPIKKLQEIGFDLFAASPARSVDVLIGKRAQFVSFGFVWLGKIWSSAPKHGVFTLPVSRVNLIKTGWHLCRQRSPS